MQVIKDSRLACFDVDETLLQFDWKEYTDDTSLLVFIEGQAALPNFRNIELLKQFKARGFTIIIWSQGGWQWSEVVVKLLGLEQYVDFAMSKPNWYIDDLHANAWMGTNIWLHPTDKEKDNRR